MKSGPQQIAALVVTGVLSGLVVALLVEMLSQRRERLLDGPLPQPVAPGHGSA
jgi:hypothetical protein